MKKLALLLLTIIAVGCSNDKRVIEAKDIPGEWKTIQGKTTRKAPLRNLTCDGDKQNYIVETFNFNTDGSFVIKDFCTGKTDSLAKKCSWKYEDNILILEYLYKDKEMKMVYSASDIGDNKMKWTLVYTRYEGVQYSELFGAYIIVEKI